MYLWKILTQGKKKFFICHAIRLLPIFTVMKALVIREVKQFPNWEEITSPAPKPDEVIVNIKAGALNRRDYFITQGLYPGIVYPGVLGSDGAGLVGDREVIINPNIGWGDRERVQDKHFHILGTPTFGTLAEQVVVGKDRLHDKPAHLSMEQAAALPLAGMTAYRVLFGRCQAQAGERVLISGIGGGVALFACQFAVASGCEVYVTSSSADKIRRAIDLGARGGLNYQEENWAKTFLKENKGFDVIIDSAGGAGFNELLRLAKPGARIGVYGGTRGAIPKLSPQLVFWKQLSILGSTMGSDKEFGLMVDFVNQHQIVPVVDTIFTVEESDKAFERMAKSEQFGKLVFKI